MSKVPFAMSVSFLFSVLFVVESSYALYHYVPIHDWVNRAFGHLDILLTPLLFMRFNCLLVIASCTSYAIVVLSHFATLIVEIPSDFISPVSYSLLVLPSVR